jgi:hypothetical protein
MSMTKVRGVTGGGIESRQTTHVTAKKTEPVNHSVSMNRPSMIGLQHWQNDAKGQLYQSSKATTPFGTTPSVEGVGGGRMIMPSGSQSKTPSPTPMGRGRSLFK